MQKFFNESWLVLTMGIVFALLLAGTQKAMQPRIFANREAELIEAIAFVVPGTEQREKIRIDGNDVYRCSDGKDMVLGWAVDASGTGFIDKIQLLIGLSPDGSELLGIKVVNHLETPGLGNKIEQGNPFPEQFAGKSTRKPLRVEKRPPQADHEVQAITGATYSSKYVTDVVNDVMDRIVPQLPAAGQVGGHDDTAKGVD